MQQRDETARGAFEARAKGVLGRIELRLFQQGVLHELPAEELWLLVVDRVPGNGSDWRLCRAHFDKLHDFTTMTVPEIRQRIKETEGCAVLALFLEGEVSYSELIELRGLLPPHRRQAAS